MHDERARPTPAPVNRFTPDMYICICNAVTDHEIRAAVDSGHSSFGQVSRELGVATNCGKCKTEACRVIREHLGEAASVEIVAG